MPLPDNSPIPMVHLITSLHVGGAQMHLYKTLCHFDRRRFDSTVISLITPGKVGEMLAREGIRVLSLDMAKGRPSLTGFWKLVVLLKKLRPTLLQTHLYHADLLGFLAGKIAGVPFIFWNIRQSNMDFSRYRQTTARTVRLCAALSTWVDKILVNSYAGLEHHANLGYNRRKMLVVPNGFDPEQFRPLPAQRASVRQELHLSHQARLVGMTARFDPQKDHTTFFQAASMVARCEPQAYFLLAGHGLEPHNPEVQFLIKSSGLAPARVRLLGERSDMPRLMAGLDVYVSSSAFGEGFPNAIGEAMACGVPCVVTDVGDSALIVGDTGMVAPPRQPELLTRGILEILNLPGGARLSKSAAARQRILQNFTISSVVRRLESLYEQTQERHAPIAQLASAATKLSRADLMNSL
jgi:glycosyltransferase involved in cell wall biosynthesis